MLLPKSSTMMLRHEPTQIATTGYQMTASSPRGTFSQAELTAPNSRRVRQIARGCGEEPSAALNPQRKKLGDNLLYHPAGVGPRRYHPVHAR
jgi:hypothetical protein